MKPTARPALFAFASVLALSLGMPAFAQVTDDNSSANDGSVLGQDIVVTAQKRDERLQDVGIAIVAFSGDQLRALGVDKSSDIATFTPAVHISGSLAGQNTQFTIRGVTQNDFNDIVEAPNAVYLDEGYIPIAQGQSFAVLDIERVEILKGPQGTLFGRNATGGLVHYISRKPSLEKWEGFVDTRLGLMDSASTPGVYTIEAAAGGPLSSTFAVRGAIRYNKQDPWLINQYPLGAVGGSPGAGAGADLGDDDSLTARLSLLFRPTDNSEFILSGNYSRSKVSTGPYQQKGTIPVYNAAGELINVQDVGATETRASIIPVGSLNSINGDFGSDLNNDGVVGGANEIYGRAPGANFFGYTDPDGPGPLFSSDFAFSDSGHIKTWGLALRGHVDLSDSITLSTVSDYKRFDKLLFIDVDASPANQLANYGDNDASSFSQELRLSGTGPTINWVAGLYYLRINNLSRNGLKAPINGLVPGNPLDIASTARLKTSSYSAFGQFDYDLSDQFRVVIGGRIIREEKDYNFIQQLFISPDSRAVQPPQTVPGFPLTIGPIYPGGVPTAYADKDGKTLWAGKLQFEYRPNTNTLFYIGVNRGTKAGSYNAQLNGGIPTSAAAIKYRDETLTNFEGGFKLALADSKVRLNGAIYYYDYKNYQSFLFTGVSGLVVNADARTIGGELTLQANPMRGLDLSLGISQFDAKVKNLPLRVGGPISRDVKPTYAPETQISGLARYAWDALGGEMSVRADGSYSASYFYNLRNFDADKFPSYFLLNVGVGWTSANRNWEFGLGADNVTNEQIGIQGFDLATLCGCNEVSYKTPRTFTLKARYSF